MKLYDQHIHTIHSHDGHQTVKEVCIAGMTAGLSGISVTDHFDLGDYPKNHRTADANLAAKQEMEALKEQYTGRLELFSGIEVGDGIQQPDTVRREIAWLQPDVVLGSVHGPRFPSVGGAAANEAFSQIPFSAGSVSEKTIAAYLDTYFRDVLATASTQDLDILTHLTVPLRYIVGKYNRIVTLNPYTEIIREIYRTIIARGIALEVNLSGLGTGWNTTMPDKPLLQLYRDAGGTLVTLGSDAHTSDRVGQHFEEGVALLQECGFNRITVYRRRKAEQIRL